MGVLLATGNPATQSADPGHYLIYDNLASNLNTYGGLYYINWDGEAISHAIPSNWHLPSKSDFEDLLSNAGTDTFSFITNTSLFSAKAGGEVYTWTPGGCPPPPYMTFSNKDKKAIYISSTIDVVNSTPNNRYFYALVVDYDNNSARIQSVEVGYTSGSLSCGVHRAYVSYSVRLVHN